MPQPAHRRTIHTTITAGPRRPPSGRVLAPAPRPWWKRWVRVDVPRHSQPVIHWPVVAAACAMALLVLGVVIAELGARAQRSIQSAAAAQPVATAAETRNLDASAADGIVSATELPPFEGELCWEEAEWDAENEADLSAGNLPVPPIPRTSEAPVASGSGPAQPALILVKRRDTASEEELRKQLIQAPEVNLGMIPPKTRKLVAAASKDKRFSPEQLPDYAGLPLRMGVDCQLGKEPAESLEVHARKLRGALAAAVPKKGADRRPNLELLREALDEECELWHRAEAVPALTQMLMAEDKPIRGLLVEYLAGNPSRAATVALTQRALFDVVFEIREQAVRALAPRPREDYRSVLLDGLRYPWAPAADHAPEALVALQDTEAVPALEAMLREPDPQAPALSYERGGVAIRELVRINHLSNCTLCHASSGSATEPVRGLIPSPSQALPPLVQYYESGGGSFVRADVTYLRQDFSMPQPVARPGNWPAHQRYDYFVRTRDLSYEELNALKKKDGEWARRLQQPSPQREAMLYALRELRETELSQ